MKCETRIQHIRYKGKTYSQKVMKKDGYWVISGEEYEKLRKQIYGISA